jgi:hypothetical protein
VKNFRTFLSEISPDGFAAALSSGYFGATLALAGDLMGEGLKQALRMAWLLEETSPDDVLALVGLELRMPRYPSETSAAYRARLVDAFNRYSNAGTPARINAEIAAAGLNGTVTFQPTHPGPPPALAVPYWSQFWITTTHVDEANLGLLRAIAAKWKSVQWLFRGFIFTGYTSQLFAIGEAAVGEDAVGG